jgi:DNA-binding Lrp family transcriptional regulator
MHDGLHHLTTIAHRTGIPRTVVWRRMKSMLADGSVTVQRIGTADFYSLKDI